MIALFIVISKLNKTMSSYPNIYTRVSVFCPIYCDFKVKQNHVKLSKYLHKGVSILKKWDLHLKLFFSLVNVG